jgi:signal transduction histidine kinase
MILTLVTGVVSIVVLRSTAARKDELTIALADELSMVERLRYRAEQVVATSRGYLLTGDERYVDRFLAARRQLDADIELLAERLEPGEADYLARIRDSGTAYVGLAARAIERRGAEADARAVVPYFEDVLQPARILFEARLDELVRHHRGIFQLELQRSRALARRAELVIETTTLVGLLLGALLGITVVRQLAERFKREEEAVQDAKRAVAGREEILAVVSHDLRNPLGAILMSASVIQKRLSPAEEGVRPRLETIQRAAEGMRHLIEDVLEAARIDGKTLELEREPCDAGEVLRAAAELFELRAERKSMTLVLEPPAPRLAVWADRQRLLRVLSNLLGNAVKFTPDGGEIVIRAERSGDLARFTVRDTGPGISPEQIAHLFERNWQARRSGTDGLGLGLYIARSLVERHGGKIWVDSRLGDGSTFAFTVPTAMVP